MPDADAYDYDLPRELIAQEPLADRSAARMLVVRRSDGALAHRHVRDLVDLLHPDDLLVVNDTRVVPARVEGRREKTGGRWEGLWLESLADGDWRLLAHTRGRMAIGERVVLVDADGADRFTLEMTGRGPGGTWLARPDRSGTVEQLLGEVGRVPLPGYIRGGDARADDLARYQTVFARLAGSAAAPTAGLHFTPALLAALADRGIGMARVTLHVGIDTFRPIAVDNLDDHPMHTEWCECPPETVAAVAAARGRGGRVIAVGTTAVRTLETAAGAGTLAPWSGPTSLFIRPGHTFRAVDCLLTNFHMPRTTLMVLVSTFAGRGLVERAYAEAIAERYRFLSYGDCVFFEEVAAGKRNSAADAAEGHGGGGAEGV
jgi:S-adenosylmethionine:tRNA ribosyltransferase-isomerase